MVFIGVYTSGVSVKENGKRKIAFNGNMKETE